MVTNRRLIDNGGADFYPSPRWGTLALLKHAEFEGTILEPYWGTSDMAKVLKGAGYQVHASDLYDRGHGETRDFFSIDKPFDNVVTNCPFNLAGPMVLHALKLARRKVAFLLRTAFLESGRRYRSVQSPTMLLVFAERLSMYKKGHKVQGGGTTSYSWFIWDKAAPSEPTRIAWIAPGLKPKKRGAR